MNMKDLRERIKICGLTFSSIAKKIGLSKSLYSKIMHQEPGSCNNIALTKKALLQTKSEIEDLINEL